MGITSAGMQSRMGGCGEHSRASDGTVESAEYNGSLSRITSTAASKDEPQAKAKVLARLEVATRKMTCAFLYEPRAAFYTDNPPKMQNINARIASGVRKNFR
ncbi:TPA: hypothetical protein N2N50_004237 [Kluyvera ascorbata]|nr:hypothetical protein [Kluyvera ascorbata]HCL5623184.1 hypothetical protein [Kluyvera ascorbata]HED3202949.1 hypothetical protein [Kluyvera ascorbata]HED4089480.1 hypothetical protein [Kluyvera ascorbata]